jgi:hypothetical protein
MKGSDENGEGIPPPLVCEDDLGYEEGYYEEEYDEEEYDEEEEVLTGVNGYLGLKTGDLASYKEVDAWSGMIMWFRIWPGNGDPTDVARWFLEACLEHNGTHI